MWSASGEDGSRPASQVRRTWQMGQCSSPAARAERLAVAALWSQRVVPVREVVTCPPRARAHAARVTLLCVSGPRRFSPFPSPQKGGNSGAQSSRGRLGSDTLPMFVWCAFQWWPASGGTPRRVAVWSHGWGVLLWGAPIVDAPSPCVDTPSPLLMGCPCFVWGWGVCCSPPLCCGLPHCLCAPPGLAFIVYGDIHLSHRERPIPQLHREEEP